MLGHARGRYPQPLKPDEARARVALCRRLIGLRYQRCELIERAGNRADHVGRDLRVERSGLQLGMPKQNLDQANVDILFQQMGGKAVP